MECEACPFNHHKTDSDQCHITYDISLRALSLVHSRVEYCLSRLSRLSSLRFELRETLSGVSAQPMAQGRIPPRPAPAGGGASQNPSFEIRQCPGCARGLGIRTCTTADARWSYPTYGLPVPVAVQLRS